jgi:predicted membrane protein
MLSFCFLFFFVFFGFLFFVFCFLFFVFCFFVFCFLFFFYSHGHTRACMCVSVREIIEAIEEHAESRQVNRTHNRKNKSYIKNLGTVSPFTHMLDKDKAPI